MIINQEEFEKRVNDRWPNQPFKTIMYSKMTGPVTIKCLRCNETTTYSSAQNFLRSPRTGICYCYNNKNKKTKHMNNKRAVIELLKERNYKMISLGYRQDTKKYTVTYQCNKCLQNITKPWGEFIKHPNCYFCDTKQKMNSVSYNQLLPDGYSLVSNYINNDTPVFLKHECGFIWKITPHAFCISKGCPKCYRKRSRGEQKISNFLDKHFIPYAIEYYFDWQDNKNYKYDFYLPEQELIIEYMGEQHYMEKGQHFKYTLKEQQEIDSIKKQAAIEHGIKYLAIGYMDYENINNILSEKICSTTMRKQ